MGLTPLEVLAELRAVCQRGLAGGASVVELANLLRWVDRRVAGFRYGTPDGGPAVLSGARVGPFAPDLAAAPDAATVDVAEASILLGCSTRRVRHLAQAGRLGVAQPPTGWRLLRSEVEARAAAHRMHRMQPDGAGGGAARLSGPGGEFGEDAGDGAGAAG